jgi:hypothetical protein
MSRRSRYLVGSLSLALVLLIVAAAALAKPATPMAGRFSGSAEAPGALAPGGATFKVSKSGSKFAVEVTLTLTLTCQVNGQPFPVNTVISSKSFKQNESGAPLPVKNGKFSYKGAIYGATPGTAEISGTFKSATKVVGSAHFSWASLELAPTIEAPCDSGKLTLTATHG